MYSPGGKRLPLKLDEPFAIYSRNTFDTFLRERARDAGAHVLAEKISFRNITKTESGWTIRLADGEELNGKWLAAADGANSPFAKNFAGPLPPAEMEVAFGYRAPLPDESSAPTVVAFLPGWVGYAWAFPRPDHLSFGIATSQETFEHDHLRAFLWDFIYRYYGGNLGKFPLMRLSQIEIETRKSELGLRLETYAGRIPKLREGTVKERRMQGSNWVLIGDAAGFADAVTGEGIYYALLISKLFARDLFEWLSGNLQ